MPALVGRDLELELIDDLLSAIGRGEGRSLVIRGEPGLGKTALVEAAEARATGVRVISIRAVESESELTFAALFDLLAPIHDAMEELPEPQAAALAGALGLGPPVAGDRFSVCAAAVSLLTAAAAERPLLLVVDDVQWLDRGSAECILYAARRPGAHVGMLLTIRPAADGDLDLQLPEIALGPLDDESSLMLLRSARENLPSAVERTLLSAAAGSPLALLELPVALSPQQASGREPLDLPLAPGPALARWFRLRSERLPAETRRALLVAASAWTEELPPVVAACERLGILREALEAAEVEGFVSIGAGRIRFCHPLARGTVYHDARPAERRRAHAALAEAVGGAAKAWHLAGAAPGYAEDAAAALDAVAAAALGRRGYVAAGAALERAARLSRNEADRARRLVGAASALVPVGMTERADELLEEALALELDPVLHAEAQHLRCRARMWAGRPGDAIGLLVEEAARIGAGHRVVGSALLADAALAATMTGECRRALALAQEGARLLGPEGDAEARAQVLSILGWSLVLRGEGERARVVLDEVERLAPEIDPLSPAAQSVFLALNSRLPLAEFERARSECLSLVAAARRAGALSAVPTPLVVAADAAYRLGEWDAVDAETRETMELGRETGQLAPLGHAVVTRARLTAARGQESETRALVQQGQAAIVASGQGSGSVFLHAAEGLLELGLGHVGAAIAALEHTARIAARSGLEDPSLVPWRPDLIEAYAREGRAQDATRALARFGRRATRSGSIWARSAYARCAGLLSATTADASFEEALRLDGERPMPFERARTLLAYGARLHRDRRRVEARCRLREALAIFDELGAGPWSDRTRSELRAAGAIRRRSAPAAKLTEQELRVAIGCARGLTNREIAAELFLSPKTVEFHLGRIYRKLGLRSRAQLAAQVAAGALTDPDDAGVGGVPEHPPDARRAG